jgi:precorrin-6B methylase 2
MAIRRIGYDELDIKAALASPALAELPMCERLLIGMVLRHDAVLYTVNPRLRQRRDLPVVGVSATQEQEFPEYLEQLYRVSLALRLSPEEL